MFIGHHASVLHLRQAHDHTLASSNIAEHTHQQILHELEMPDRTTKLLSLLSVFEGVFIGSLRATNRFPSHTCTRHAQNGSHIFKRMCLLEPIGFWHTTVFQGNVCVLHHAQGYFIAKFFWLESSCTLLDHKAFHLAI